MAVIISGEIIWGLTGTVFGAVGAAVVGARRLAEQIRPVREALKELRYVVEDWNGVPDRPGVPGRPGMMVRLANHDEALTEIRRELITNGGSSLRDAVKRTEQSVLEVRDQLGQVLAVHAAEERASDGRTN